MNLTVNGKAYTLDVEEDMPLLWALRDELDIKGPKFGCGAGLCGACTVWIDGKAVKSCQQQVGSVTGAVTTIEGISNGATLHTVQQAWIEEHLGWSVEVVRHPPKPRGVWVCPGQVVDWEALRPKGFRGVLPRVGGLLSGDRAAYAYLPASVGLFPTPDAFAALMTQAGFAEVHVRSLTLGIAYLYRGERTS